jgi:uncharacterized membrane protein
MPAGQDLALMVLFVTGLALRLYGLGPESVWYLELWVVSIARMEPVGLVCASLGYNNPPLYYLILHYWMLVAGDSEFAFRLPSAIAGALAIRWSTESAVCSCRGTGLMAALTLSLSAYHIR